MSGCTVAKRVLLCLSHSIEEHDQLDLLSSLGYEVASIGGYINPQEPHDKKRPPLKDVPYFPEVQAAVDALGTDDNLGLAQSHIPEPILEWLGTDGVIIFHHYLSQRLYPQWEHLAEWRAAGGRVIWRTVGQSVENNEREAQPFRDDGLEIVRYSPREQGIPGYAGSDAMIRFWKDPKEWRGWIGDELAVINFTQHLWQREPWTNWTFWEKATRGLTRIPLGPGSEAIGGPGELEYWRMKLILQHARCYLYTGTQPASYTLGLLEALMTGVPVVSIGPSHMNIFPYGPDLYEGHLLSHAWFDDPSEAHVHLAELLSSQEYANEVSQAQRAAVIAEFGREPVGVAWRRFLGDP